MSNNEYTMDKLNELEKALDSMSDEEFHALAWRAHESYLTKIDISSPEFLGWT